jgi:hypothetical protein
MYEVREIMADIVRSSGRWQKRKEDSSEVTCRERNVLVGFRALTPAVMKGFIFWDIMPCSPSRKSIDVSEEHFASIIRF